ncbi:MAG: hypothetical protein HZB09_01605 [Candidatus Yonathbacteria bacterium]|nr:hypothetical protein [Candidatus Yonathbacteria bacterium]
MEIPVFVVEQASAPGATSTAATSSVKLTSSVGNPEYKNILALFATTTSPNIKRKLLVKNTGGALHISWAGSIDSTPYYFCANDICKKEILIKPRSKLISFDFFPGRDDLLIMGAADGIYVTEIDDRSTQNIQTLLKGKNLDFRIDDGVIYIKKDKNLYYVSF